MSDPTPGFWDGVAAPATVDWCEPNYAVTPYVAEFWNATSSLWMVVLGGIGMALLANRRRFHGMFAGLGLVGIGSAAFHGTLLRPAQALDELPMVFLSLHGAWIVAHRGKNWNDGHVVAAVLVAFAVVFSGTYYTLPWAFSFFLLVYGGMVTWLTLTSAWLTLGRGDARQTRLLWGAAGGFFGGLVGCWIPEHLLLSCDHPIQSLHLHSIWHLLAGTGTFTFILWMIGMDDKVRQGALPEASGPSAQAVDPEP